MPSYSECLECVERSALPLRPHQRKVVEFLARDRVRGLLAVHSVGSGKTLTAVVASQCFLDRHPRSKVVIVTPSSLIENFRKEIRAYGADPDDPRYHYFTLSSFLADAQAGRILDCRGSLLIIDEAHNLRTHIVLRPSKSKAIEGTGLKAYHLLEAAKRARKVLLLTATPLINEPEEIINLMAMVDGSPPVSLSEFRRMENYERYFRCKVSVFDPTQEARQAEYPRVTTHNIVLKMSPTYLTRYREVESLCRVSESVRVFYNGLRKGANALEGDRSPKIDWVMDHLRDSAEGERHVVFSHFLASGLHLLMNRLKKEGIPYAHITGDVEQHRRELAIRRYNEGLLKVLIISKAGGEGIDLKNTTSMVIMEPSWNEATHRQVIGRAVRFQSHVSLPRAKQHVAIYRLHMVKPSEVPIVKTAFSKLWLENEDGLNSALSIDLYLRNRSRLKQIELDEFVDHLRRGSIEQRTC